MDPSLIKRKFDERGPGSLDKEELAVLLKSGLLTKKDKMQIVQHGYEDWQEQPALSNLLPGARGSVNRGLKPQQQIQLPSNEDLRQEALRKYGEQQQLKRDAEAKAQAEHEAKVQALGPLDQYPAMTYDPAAAEFLPPEKKKQLANRFMKTRGMLQKKTDKALTPEEE